MASSIDLWLKTSHVENLSDFILFIGWAGGNCTQKVSEFSRFFKESSYLTFWCCWLSHDSSRDTVVLSAICKWFLEPLWRRYGVLLFKTRCCSLCRNWWSSSILRTLLRRVPSMLSPSPFQRQYLLNKRLMRALSPKSNWKSNVYHSQRHWMNIWPGRKSHYTQLTIVGSDHRFFWRPSTIKRKRT